MMTTDTILKDLLEVSRENGKGITKLSADMSAMATLQAQQNELLITKINSRMDAVEKDVANEIDIRKIEHDKNKSSHGDMARNISDIKKKLLQLESQPANEALAKNKFISKTVGVAIIVAVITTIVCILGTVLAANLFGLVR